MRNNNNVKKINIIIINKSFIKKKLKSDKKY